MNTTAAARTYPLAYTCDTQRRMKTMTTWQNYAARTGAATTTWNYDLYRSWLTNKTYDGRAAGPSYTYTPAGRLYTRAWARRVWTTNAYDNAGQLSAVAYSDSTPALSFTYDRRGRQAQVAQGPGGTNSTSSLLYKGAGQLLSESYTAGPLTGLSVNSTYDQLLRRSNLALNYQQSTLSTINYSYDFASRLSTVTDNTTSTPYSATYTYLTNSPLVGQIVFANNGTTRMTTTKQYDFLSRLMQISSVPQAAPSVSYSYLYNAANQRVRSRLADGSYWVYTYDSLGQVIAGNKYWSDDTPVAGQQFQYAFDTIGNRTATKAGGDQSGAGLRPASYTANNLNQYTNRTVPGYVDVMGLGLATTAVTVNSQTAYRKGEYFRQQLSVTNTSLPVWESVTVAGTNQNSPEFDLKSDHYINPALGGVACRWP